MSLPSEISPLIKGVRSSLVQDPSSDLAGFVASELIEEEEEEEEEGQYGIQDSVQEMNSQEHPSLSPLRLHTVIFSMYLGSFLAALDMTVVTTLLGRIASEFNSLPQISWIATSYLVSSATFQPLYGKISDIFGRRSLLLFSNITFGLGCLLCYLSTNIGLLIFARFISGIGGGGLTSLSSITTSDLIPLKSRGLYQGLLNVGFGAGTALGSVIGGWFETHPSLGGWRGAFLFQVPLSILSTLLIYFFLVLPKGSTGNGVSGSDVNRKLKLIDWFGAITLTIFLILFLLGCSIIGNNDIQWKDIFEIKAFSLILFTILALYGFVFTELKIAKNPILPLRFFTISTVTGASFANFFFCCGQFAIFYYLPIYFSVVIGLNSEEVGKRYTPNFFSIVIGSLGSGIYMKKTGRYHALLIICGFITVIGQTRIVLVKPDIPTWQQYFLLAIPGTGMSTIITATLLALIAAVPHEHQAATTSISYLFRSCGSTIGVSVGSAVFSKTLKIRLNEQVLKFLQKGYSLEELENIIYEARHSSSYVNEGAPKFIKATLIESYAMSSKIVFLFALVLSLLGFGSLFLIKEYTLHSSISRK